jgi:hypothetical protein
MTSSALTSSTALLQDDSSALALRRQASLPIRAAWTRDSSVQFGESIDETPRTEVEERGSQAFGDTRRVVWEVDTTSRSLRHAPSRNSQYVVAVDERAEVTHSENQVRVAAAGGWWLVARGSRLAALC